MYSQALQLLHLISRDLKVQFFETALELKPVDLARALCVENPEYGLSPAPECTSKITANRTTPRAALGTGLGAFCDKSKVLCIMKCHLVVRFSAFGL